MTDAKIKIALDESLFSHVSRIYYFQDDIATLRNMYPQIAHWKDVAVSNAWWQYSQEVDLVSEKDPATEEEFIYYLLLKSANREDITWCDLETIRKEGSKYEVNWDVIPPVHDSDAIAKIVTETMAYHWNDWVGDTGTLPNDFEVSNPRTKVSFTPKQWAERVAESIAEQLTKRNG